MLSISYSSTLFGIDAKIVQVEVNTSSGIPSFDIVGLPDSTVKESKDRIKTAITNSGIDFPIKKITVNLAPAYIKKEGSAFDLPICVSILACSNIIDNKKLSDVFIAGELSLDGSVIPVNGILSMVDSAYKNGFKKCIVSSKNALEASLIKNIEVIGVDNIKDTILYFNENVIKPIPENFSEFTSENIFDILDFSDVKGQESVKRALLICASGNHNALLIGPPGSGKTMMAKRLPSILPPLTYEESIEVTKIYSISNMMPSNNVLITKRPFREPHHTLSFTALTGGTSKPKPGEISLAHNGILFLDELPEFSRKSLEVLREPLEDRVINISRASSFVSYPAKFMLVATMNPCPCGYYGSSTKCSCTDSNIKKYLSKISGPLLDRIDVQIEADSVKYDSLSSTSKTISSSELKEIVLRTIDIQRKRYSDESFNYNSELSAKSIEKYCPISEEIHTFLKDMHERLNLSARAYHKILKVSRTIADIEQKDDISLEHILEAVQYRTLDRKYW